MRAKNKALLKSSHFLEQQVGNNSQERVPEDLHHEAAQPPHVWQHMRRAVLGLPVGLALPMAQTAWAQLAAGARMALEGTRMHSSPREGAACLLLLLPGTVIHGNLSLALSGGQGNVWSSCTQNANLVTDTGEGETG